MGGTYRPGRRRYRFGVTRWNERADAARGDAYDERWATLEAAGESVHGEADLVEALLVESFGAIEGRAVLDAGCGTGRVAVELDRRGADVVGVDLDPSMLDTARAKSDAVGWHLADLAEIDLARTFDVVVAAGTVLIFVAPGTEPAGVDRRGAHLRPGGLLVAGFQVAADRLPPSRYDHHAAAAGLELVHRWSTWGRAAFTDGDYAVSVHRRPHD